MVLGGVMLLSLIAAWIVNSQKAEAPAAATPRCRDRRAGGREAAPPPPPRPKQGPQGGDRRAQGRFEGPPGSDRGAAQARPGSRPGTAQQQDRGPFQGHRVAGGPTEEGGRSRPASRLVRQDARRPAGRDRHVQERAQEARQAGRHHPGARPSPTPRRWPTPPWTRGPASSRRGSTRRRATPFRS